ncbi:MAG: PilZ domain-containing protein [Candidatus Aminicenantes bacterium]|nr:MAG: PilZ domain-containing protein [Candidatus Aminicenantes bacterium]
MTKKSTSKKTAPKKTAAKKAAPKKTLRKDKDITNIEINRRREWRFDLPLPVKIEGKLPQGKKFKESTKIENISSKGVYFSLDSGVIIGSKLNLVIDMPKELGGDKKLKLCLGGLTVRLEELNEKTKKQGVALRFHKKYKIMPKDVEKK